jgi:dynein heavy chain
MLIGVGGSGRQSLSKLASIVMNYDIFSIEITKAYSIEDWKADLKKLMIAAGIENKKITFIITDSHIKHDTFLENINSIINSGEVPNLFPNEEKENVLERMLEKRGMSIKNEMERWDEFA